MARDCDPGRDPPLELKPPGEIVWPCPPPENTEPEDPVHEQGTPGAQSGNVLCWNGPGDPEGGAPGTASVADANGTLWSIFVTADGIVRVHDSLPTSDTDGAVVGTQF